MDIVTYKLSQKYADKVAAGFSSVRVDGLDIIFTLNDGKTATVTVPAPKDGQDGVSITDVSLNQQSHLICTLSDGTAIDAGLVHQGVDGKDGKDGADGAPGQDGVDGQDGNGIISIEKTGTEGLVDTYTIYFTNGTTTTFTVTNGSGGSGTSDYDQLDNKPSINNNTLTGDKTSSQLGLQSELVSGTNIKTINNISILGSGNINISGGGGSVDYYEEAKTLLTRLNNEKYNNPQATQATDEYDIILFSGQSNSCGRARTSDATAPLDVFLNIPTTKAITFNNSSNGTPVQIVEPISANGTSYYGYIPAWLNAYYAVTGRKVCTCYSSNGGTPIANFMKGATYYGASKVENTKTALLANNKTIGHIYLVWCQGETDGDQSKTTDYYKTSFRQMLNDLKADCGIEKAFIMRIGQINSGTSEKYRPIIKAQNELAQEYDDIIMASTIFAGALNFKEEDGSTRNLMRDSFHYKPEGYVRAGLEGGSNAGYYVNSGIKPTLLEYERLRINAAGWTDTKRYEREIDKYLFTQYIPYGLQRLLDDGGATPPAPPTPTGIVVNPTTLTGAVGGTATINATIQPSGATGTIVWSTNNSSVATVSNGTVSYVGPGNATITATVQGTAYSASCSVVVSGEPVTPTGIVIDQDSVSVSANRTTQLTYTIQPTGATGTINWTSSDDTVATVSNGLVTGVAEGTATITATIDGTALSDTCAVTVTAAPEWDLLDLEFRNGKTFDDYVTNGTLAAYNGGGQSTAEGFLLARNESGSAKQPEAYFATPIQIPENFTVEWKIKCSTAHSSTSAMGQYLLQGKAYGESSERRPMLGTTKDGCAQISLGDTKSYDYNGNTVIYDVRTDNDVFHTYRYEIEGNTFEAYKDGVLIDSGNLPTRPSTTLSFGKINYREQSTASSTIDAGDVIAYIKMKTGTTPTPVPTPTGINLSEATLEGVVGDSDTLTYTIVPAGATGTVVWSSSNSNVASVVDGVVTYAAAGNATITATIDGTQISDTCDVTVTAPITPTGIELSDSAMIINQRESQQLTYTLLPAGATGTVTWSTNDASIATVNNGLVTGVGTGMTTITATVEGTQISDTCEVSVQANPYLLNLDFTNGKLPSDYVSDGTLSKSDIAGTSETDGLRITTTTTSVGNGIVFADPIQMPTNFAIEAKFQTYNNDGSRYGGVANAITLVSNGSSRPMVNLFDGYLQFRLVSSGGDQKITSLGQIYDWSTDGLVTIRVECRNKDLTVYKNGSLVGTATLSARTADTFSGCTLISTFPYWCVGDLISYIRLEDLGA